VVGPTICNFAPGLVVPETLLEEVIKEQRKEIMSYACLKELSWLKLSFNQSY